MKTTRPQFFRSIAGRYWRVTRTPLSTFTSKNRRQSASEISANGFASKIPRLFTRTSASGTRRTNASTPLALPRSAATPRAPAPPARPRMRSTADDTRASVRPLTTTAAPSSASAVAIANPMPAVEPVTTAVFPSSPRSIVWPLDSRTGAAHPRPRLARPEGPCWDLGCAALNAGGDDSNPDVRYHPRHDHPLAPRETCVLILSHP